MALQMQGYSFDSSYQINHISYGKQSNLQYIQRKFSKMGVLNPLDGLKVDAEMMEMGAGKRPKNLRSNFYINAVPSHFKDSLGFNY